MEKLNLYRTNTDYVNYLWKFTKNDDFQVKFNEKDGNFRTYIGLFSIKNINYLIPLASAPPYKTKYYSMHERPDFMKIEHKNKLKSVIDIGFMIPVPNGLLNIIDIDNEPPNNKHILTLEQHYIRKREEEIMENIKQTYNRVSKGRKYKNNRDKLVERCLNFPLLEQKMLEYQSSKEIIKTSSIAHIFKNEEIIGGKDLEVLDIK